MNDIMSKIDDLMAPYLLEASSFDTFSSEVVDVILDFFQDEYPDTRFEFEEIPSWDNTYYTVVFTWIEYGHPILLTFYTKEK